MGASAAPASPTAEQLCSSAMSTSNHSAIFDVKLRVDACVSEYPWYLIGGPYYKWKTVEEPIKRYVFFLGYPETLENSYNYIEMPDSADKVSPEGILSAIKEG